MNARDLPWLAAVVDNVMRDGDLTSADKLLLIEQARLASLHPNHLCWPSKAHLARRTGLSAGSIKRSIRRVVTLGRLTRIERQTEAGRDTTNLFRVRLPKVTAKSLDGGYLDGPGDPQDPPRDPLDPQDLRSGSAVVSDLPLAAFASCPPLPPAARSVVASHPNAASEPSAPGAKGGAISDRVLHEARRWYGEDLATVRITGALRQLLTVRPTERELIEFLKWQNAKRDVSGRVKCALAVVANLDDFKSWRAMRVRDAKRRRAPPPTVAAADPSPRRSLRPGELLDALKRPRRLATSSQDGRSRGDRG